MKLNQALQIAAHFQSRGCNRTTKAIGEWLSLVEHLVRDQGVGGSNPLSPTILKNQSLRPDSSLRKIVDPRAFQRKDFLPMRAGEVPLSKTLRASLLRQIKTGDRDAYVLRELEGGIGKEDAPGRERPWKGLCCSRHKASRIRLHGCGR